MESKHIIGLLPELMKDKMFKLKIHIIFAYTLLLK
jgi:hypothetical protein